MFGVPIFASRARSASGKMGLVVVDGQPEVFILVPIEAHPPGEGFGSRFGGIGEEGIGRRIHFQLSVTTGDLKGAPLSLFRIDGIFGNDPVVGGFFARDYIGSRRLPGLVGQLPRGGAYLHFFVGDHVFAKKAERSPVVIALRRQAPAPSVSDRGKRGVGRIGTKRKEGLLSDAFVGGEVRGALLTEFASEGSRNSDA